MPFYRDLELLRQHIARFRISFYDVMEALRTTDDLEQPGTFDPAPTAGATYWPSVSACPALSVSSDRQHPDPCPDLRLPAGNQRHRHHRLSPLQEYSRRTGVAYADLVSILRTRFVNPAQRAHRARWRRSAVPFSTLQALNDGDADRRRVPAKLPAGLDSAAYGSSVVAGSGSRQLRPIWGQT